MKKLFGLLALVLAVVSCQNDFDGTNLRGDEVAVTLNVAVPDDATRAAGSDSAKSGLQNIDLNRYDIRYILEVYDAKDSLAKPRIVNREGDSKSTSFDLRLVPGRKYTFVVWADFIPQDQEDKYVDYHYNTSNIQAISLQGDQKANDESRDAYTCAYVVEEFQSGAPIAIELKRPFAKLRVVTTDMNHLYSDLTSVTVDYTTPIYTTYNALTEDKGGLQDVATKRVDLTADFKYTNESNYRDNGKMTLFADYLFGTEDDAIHFTLDAADATEWAIPTVVFNTNIPVQRNYLTTVMGPVLTDAANVTVSIDGAFENDGHFEDAPYYQEAISSAAELIDAINGQGGEYIVVSDIAVTGNSISTLAATRAAGATTINLNGYTITLKTDIVVEAGKNIIITDTNENGEVGAIVSEDGGAIVNNGTLNIEGGHFGADTIENNNNGEVNITGGTFESNPSDFVDDDYEVKNENGVYTLEQKPVIVTIGNTEYRSLNKAVAAANQGDTILFVDDVEQADGVIITDKNITIDLNDKTFTVTNGANTNNRNFKVNGSSVVTIKNGTMVAAGEYSSGAYGTLRTEGTANVTLNDVKLYNYRGNGLNVKALSGTTVTITDAEVYSQYGGGIESAGGTVELTNVKVEQKGMYTAPYNSMAISVNGGGTVTVNSGTYSTECITAEEANNQGTSHGPWCAGVLNSGGTLIIKGGAFSNDNFGENTLATYARGLLLADTGANIQIQGGVFNAVKAIVDIQNNLGDASKNPTATISGGDFSADPLTWDGLISVVEGYVVDEVNGRYTVVKDVKVAKVGNTEYRNIDDAIAAWTNNTTLTLLSDVTLTDVIKISSTEMHTLDLGTFIMTAASGKDAIEIINNGRSSASYALDIKADATNPGGITAKSKTIVKTKGKSGVKDRPIIRFYNGVFNASNIISHSSSNGTNCPQFQFHNGIFNGTISANRALIQFYGGTFNGSLWISVDSSAYALISGGRFKQLSNLYGSALNKDKFTIGSAKGVFDRGIYVDDEGYYVVGGPVITDFGDKFAAKATLPTNADDYLTYSSAADEGLYYTNADMATAKYGEANVEVK